MGNMHTTHQLKPGKEGLHRMNEKQGKKNGLGEGENQRDWRNEQLSKLISEKQQVSSWFKASTCLSVLPAYDWWCPRPIVFPYKASLHCHWWSTCGVICQRMWHLGKLLTLGLKRRLPVTWVGRFTVSSECCLEHGGCMYSVYHTILITQTISNQLSTSNTARSTERLITVQLVYCLFSFCNKHQSFFEGWTGIVGFT